MQHLDPQRRRLVEAVEGIAATWRARIARGGEHDRDARLIREPQRPVLESSVGGGDQDLDEILVDAGSRHCVSGSPNRVLNSTTLGPSGVSMSPAYSTPVKGVPAARHLGHDRPVDRLQELVRERVGDVGAGRDGAHPAGVGPGVPVADRLVVAGGRQPDDPLAVADGEQRHLRSRHALLDDDR